MLKIWLVKTAKKWRTPTPVFCVRAVSAEVAVDQVIDLFDTGQRERWSKLSTEIREDFVATEILSPDECVRELEWSVFR